MSILTDWLIGGQPEAEAEANYERLKQLERDRLAARATAGTITPEQEARYLANTEPLQSTDAAAAYGFAEGLGEGIQNISGGVNKTLAGTIKTIFSAIPWQVWILAAIALFIWMGGLALLRGRLTR